MASDSRSNPFIKNLAANDKRIRDKALESLRKYLSGRKELSEVDLLKLWKGLFFCMWMSDKPRTQQQLARDLSSLVDLLHSTLTIPFLSAFWKTMAREWIGIDVLRMDKFLYLVRQMLNASFRQFGRRRWKNTEMMKEYLDVLREVPLSPTDPKVPNGLRYHVVDVYVDELDKVDEGRDGLCPVEEVLAPGDVGGG
ncbi:hypothetical protein K490DRAFT_59589 [Saccharata proteae CBS 121410]|uniref:Nucleolar n=1 Tax=Saccharata proteae CBS 121410 TaxID=1314787 RepID=A0A9P4HPC0_9PEZI|nr:hypothetical protein K490DRAFT_59589 [Saccharata proteae CBS 121410]